MSARVLGRLRGSIIKVLRRFAAVLRFVRVLRSAKLVKTIANHQIATLTRSIISVSLTTLTLLTVLTVMNNSGRLDSSDQSDIPENQWHRLQILQLLTDPQI